MADVPPKVGVRSEYGALKAVMVHRPSAEIERVLPSNMKSLLFDDIPYLRRMQEEFDRFTSVIESEAGATVFYVENELCKILDNPAIRKQLLDSVLTRENCRGLLEYLLDIDSKMLAHCLIVGITYSELKELGIPSERTTHDFALQPIPNLYFIRDPAAVIHDRVVFCKMHYPARAREGELLRYILKHGEPFRDLHPIFGDRDSEERPFTIEGGDVIILSKDSLVIGCSERTRSETIKTVARNLFKDDVVKRVYEVCIPAHRSYMHLDTVFTIVADDVIVAYPDALPGSSNEHSLDVSVYTPQYHFGSLHLHKETIGHSFLDLVREELGEVVIVQTGHGDPFHAEREQFADGSNVLSIGNRKAIVYDRNPHTLRALEEAGIRPIAIDGSELVRGRGGPRCMVMPISREEV